MPSRHLGPHDFAGLLQRLPAHRGKREAVRVMSDIGFRLDRYVQNFAHAVALFAFSNGQYARIEADIVAAPSELARRGAKAARTDELSMFGGWELLAARDGAASIFHFGVTMADFSKTIVQTPRLHSAVDRAKLKTANSLFSRHFREFRGIRHATAHSAETWQEAETAKHQVRGPHKGQTFEVGPESFLYTNGLMDGDTFHVTFEHRLLAYRVHPDTLTRLRAIEHTLFSAFS